MVSITADLAKKRTIRSIEKQRESMKKYHENMLKEIEEKIFSSSDEGETSVSLTTYGPCDIELITRTFSANGFDVLADEIGAPGTRTKIRFTW